MFTRCPTCQTLFRVRPDILRVAHGQVRCGRCDTQFNALDTLVEAPEELVSDTTAQPAQSVDSGFIYLRSESEPAEADSPAAPAQFAAQPGIESDADKTLCETEPGAPDDTGADAVPGEAAAAPAAPVRGEPQPGLSPAVIQDLLLQEDPAAAGRGRRWAWGAVAAVLLLVLCGQWVYLQRVHLYEYPALRPALGSLCAGLGCDLPLARAPERIEVIERQVRAHPRVAEALLVDVTFVSRAEGPIAYPVLELQLADVSGNGVAARRFAPAEYLPPGLDVQQGLAPQRPLQVRLELVAPHTDVVSFQFDFL